MQIKVEYCQECPFLINYGADLGSCWLNTDIYVDLESATYRNHECLLLKETVEVISIKPDEKIS